MLLRRALLAFMLLTGLQATIADDSALPETLRIGTSGSYPPLSFKQDGRLTGMEVALAEAVSAQLNVKTRFIEVPLDELIPALNSGKIDVIMSGLSVTEERSRKVLFTDPYMEIGQMGIIRIDDLVEWSQPRTLLTRARRSASRRAPPVSSLSIRNCPRLTSFALTVSMPAQMHSATSRSISLFTTRPLSGG